MSFCYGTEHIDSTIKGLLLQVACPGRTTNFSATLFFAELRGSSIRRGASARSKKIRNGLEPVILRAAARFGDIKGPYADNATLTTGGTM
jgi:hypothetical protein